jgi:transposase
MSIAIENLDHLGLVAGIMDEMGLVAQINEQLGVDKREKISSGQVVKAMILNGLGFVSSPLYLFSGFFEGKATEHLLGEGIKAEYLNDDRLGRVLENLYEKGLNQIFVSIIMEVVKKYEIEVGTVHVDSSSFSVQGEYEQSPTETNPQRINITYGYSRDHRPDLKQFMMDLICSEDGDIPLGMRMADGNESDQQQFGSILQEFKTQMQWESLMVLDSGFYTQENLQMSQNLSWLSRVPLRVKAAHKAVHSYSESEFIPSQQPGYRYREIPQNYGGIEQRWLLVESQKRRESDLKKLDKNLKKEAREAEKKLRQLSHQTFACVADARVSARKLLLKSRYHQLTDISLETVWDKKAHQEVYKVRGTLTVDEEKVTPYRQGAGRFILATNVLDKEVLTSEEMLSKYKGQQSVERGFRFLKDPMFFTDSVFLKSPKRIEALGLIMGLCLLVYNLGQRQLRQTLQRRQRTVPNQLGRPTNCPTLRWIFQCFQSIHVVNLEASVQISNLHESRLSLLEFFPDSCQDYYLLS